MPSPDILALLKERLDAEPALSGFAVIHKEFLHRVAGSENVLHLAVARALPGIKSLSGAMAVHAAEVELTGRSPASDASLAGAAVSAAVESLTGKFAVQGTAIAGMPASSYPVSKAVDRDEREICKARIRLEWVNPS